MEIMRKRNIWVTGILGLLCLALVVSATKNNSVPNHQVEEVVQIVKSRNQTSHITIASTSKNAIVPPQEVPIFQFEEQLPSYFRSDERSAISVSQRRYKDGTSSLEWKFSGGSALTVRHPVGFRNLNRDTFGLWIYNEKAMNEELHFAFERDGKADVTFAFQLNFTGWRTAWVPFKDMSGIPHEDMDTLVITAPDEVAEGTIYMDQLILSTPVDPRYPTRDMQVAFVNMNADQSASAHWQSLYVYDSLLPAGMSAQDAAAEEIASLAKLNVSFTELITEPITINAGRMSKYRSDLRQFGIKKDGDVVTGRPVTVIHIEDIYPAPVKQQVRYIVNAVNVADYTDFMLQIANAYHHANHADDQKELRKMFIDLSLHLRDQGWEWGHSTGTVHHLGYNIKSLYPSLFLMKDVLEEAGLRDWAQKTMIWFSGLGRIFEPLEASYANIDILNTKLQGMLASILMMEQDEERVYYMRRFTEWLSSGLLPAPGLMPALKPDGSGYHHMGFYPAYTRDAFQGLAPVVMLLGQSEFRITEEAHEWLKKAMLSMRLYSNNHEWLISVSGRHPTGKERLLNEPYKYMALAGTPDGAQDIDPDMAAAYLRLVESYDATAHKLREMGYTPESDPNGHWTMNYGTLTLHRRADWLVGVRGHNRYFWAGELYTNANWYGRYTTYGQIQIMSGKSNLASGYVQEGWDWNRWPGTTAIRLPLDELKARSFTEMLLTDETYAGGLNIAGQNGMFAMKLHEHPKYDESHRARKSVFMFDHRIIALGSSIENTDTEHSTETTLFQSYLSKSEDAIWVGSMEVVQHFPYEHAVTSDEPLWLMDNRRNGYYIPAGHTIGIHKKTQYSKDQKNGSETKGNFTAAWIDHGKAPQDAQYEYAILVGVTPEEMDKFTSSMADESTAPYRVLKQDHHAHIVWDRVTNTTGYALFDEGVIEAEGYLASVDMPSMVMIKETEQYLVIAAVDPDLRFYEGIDPEQYDKNGQFVGAGAYTRPWRFNESQAHTITLTLNGEWALLETGANFRILSSGQGKTVLEVDSKDALPVEFRLIPA